MQPENQPSPNAISIPPNQEWITTAMKLLADLKFGSLEIVVHEGRVVQIEKREKIRLDQKKRQ